MMNIKSFPMTGIQEELKVKGVKIFELDELDAVAAQTEKEAISFYTELTGVEVTEAKEIPRDYEVYEDESMEKKRSVGSLVDEDWDGEPFIVYTTNY
ncbi:hypothetical protein AB3N02_13970 [Priestia aryabhattai]|uniref:hypothetical protein n=1 Tax=Priestia aryabhattai TaxID=412384 RepID=UPI0039A0A2D7